MYFKTPLIKIPSVLKARWMIVSFVRYLGVVYVVSISEILLFYYIEYLLIFSLPKRQLTCQKANSLLIYIAYLILMHMAAELLQCFSANKEEFVVLYCKHVLTFR